MTVQEIKAIPITMIVAEAIELAAAIYEHNEDLLRGYAEYLIDEATQALGERDIEPETITQMLMQEYA